MDIAKYLAATLVLGLAAACANGITSETGAAESEDGGGRLDSTDDAAAEAGAAVPPDTTEGGETTDAGASASTKDSGASDATAKVFDASSTDSGTACQGVRVNELQADGVTASDEFVELYNTSATCTVSLAGMTLGYLSASGNGNAGKPIVYFTGTAADTIPPHGYFVIAGSGFSGPKNASLSGGLAAAGGRVGILDGANVVLDAVGYGTATPGPLVQTSAAKVPPSSQSIGRVPDGKSTGDNASDFVVLTIPTPGAPN